MIILMDIDIESAQYARRRVEGQETAISKSNRGFGE